MWYMDTSGSCIEGIDKSMAMQANLDLCSLHVGYKLTRDQKSGKSDVTQVTG